MRSNRLAALAVFAVAAGVGLTAQGGVEKAQLEIDAAAEKGDKAAYDRFLLDDFSWVDNTGRLRDKKTVIAGLQPQHGTTLDVEVRSYPGGAVLVARRPNPSGAETRFMRLWIQRGNQWRLAAHQGNAIGKPPAPSTNASSPLPPNSGPAAEIKAIEQAIAALAAGNSKGDAKNFAASVTDGFVSVSANGEVKSKQQRIDEISKGLNPNAPAGASVVEQSNRIYGNLAVTNRLSKTPNGGNRQMIIHTKQNERWLRAAIMTTLIATGK